MAGRLDITDGAPLWDADDDSMIVRNRTRLLDQRSPDRQRISGIIMASEDDDEEDEYFNHDTFRTANSHRLLANSDSSNVPLMREGSTRRYTVEEAIEQLGVGCFQLKMFLFCGLFSITDALEMMLLSVLSPEVRCEWNLSDWQVALISTIVFIGMFLGSNFWGSLSDKHGRRPILLMAACWISYFGILTSQSPNFVWIVILRGLVGVGFGGAVQNFTLLTEYLPSKYRAKLLIMYNIMWAFGTSFEILMAYLIIPLAGWRILVLVSALPMIVTLIFTYAIPESCRYLLAAGHKEQAQEILRKISKSNRTPLPPGELVESPPVPRGRYSDLMRHDYRFTVLLVWLMWFGSACTYYGIILSQSEILEMGGVCGSERRGTGKSIERCSCRHLTDSDYVSMIVATFGEFFSIPVSLLTVDWLGRKWTLGINFFGTAVFCVLCQICTSRTLLLTAFMFGIRSFITGAFNIVYVYTVEVLPTTVRSIGLGSSSAAARLGALLTPFVAQVLMSYSVRLSLGFYTALMLACTGAAFLLPIETRGRALQQSH